MVISTTPKEVRASGTTSCAGAVRMVRVELSREGLAGERVPEQVDDFSGFGAAADHGVDAEFLRGAGFLNLPCAGSAEDDGEAVSLPACTNRVEHPPGIQRVDRFARGPENRGVHARRERRAERVVGGHRDRTRTLADEVGQLVGVTDHDLIGAEFARQHGFEHPQPRRGGAGTAVRGRRHLAPRRILLVDHPFHPPGNRGQGHLDEEARVIDALGQRRRQHDWRAGVMAHPLTPQEWSCQ